MMRKDFAALDPPLFYIIDTNLSLIDTTSEQYRKSGKYEDTVLMRGNAPSCVEVSENNLLFGSVQDISGHTSYIASGLTKFDLHTKSVSGKSALHFDSAYDGVMHYNAIGKPFTLKNNVVYTLGMNWYGGAYFSGHNYLRVIRFDTSGNIIWYRQFGGTTYVNAWSIHACMDGSLMVLATSFNGNPDNKRDFLIFKLKGSTGEPLSMVKLNNGPKPALTVYPNPTAEVLYVEDAPEGSLVTLHTLTGSIVDKLVVGKGVLSIFTSHLQPGVYLYEVKDVYGQRIGCGKWIKK